MENHAEIRIKKILPNTEVNTFHTDLGIIFLPILVAL